MPYLRKKTREIIIGNIKIGGSNPIAIQSMCNTDTRDAKATINQILSLEKCGCQIVRVAVPDLAAANAIGEIKKAIHIPIVADIHFDYRLALSSIENGVDKIRINPGNIGEKSRVKEVVSKARLNKVPIRIGVNSGSLEPEILKKHGGITPDALVESALSHVKILEDMDFYDTVVSIKSSDVLSTIEAYEKLSNITDYPLHIGITEAGTLKVGTIKSAVGIGALLAMGIGDTIRVSLTGDPLYEIPVAKYILKSLGLYNKGINLISCPTCGRTEIDLINIANEIEHRCEDIEKPLTVAVMGCIVNGPGEARDADIGIAGGKGKGVIFKKGQIFKTVPEESLVLELMKEIEKMTQD